MALIGLGKLAKQNSGLYFPNHSTVKQSLGEKLKRELSQASVVTPQYSIIPRVIRFILSNNLLHLSLVKFSFQENDRTIRKKSRSKEEN